MMCLARLVGNNETFVPCRTREYTLTGAFFY